MRLFRVCALRHRRAEPLRNKGPLYFIQRPSADSIPSNGTERFADRSYPSNCPIPIRQENFYRSVRKSGRLLGLGCGSVSHAGRKPWATVGPTGIIQLLAQFAKAVNYSVSNAAFVKPRGPQPPPRGGPPPWRAIRRLRPTSYNLQATVCKLRSAGNAPLLVNR